MSPTMPQGLPSRNIMTPLPPPPSRPSPFVNPRRAAAHRSVSLLHHARKPPPPATHLSSSSTSSSAAHAGDQKRDSPSSLAPLANTSSGESSNAEKWFERSNTELHGTTASFADNDPPYLMQNSSSSSTPPNANPRLHFLRAREDSNSLPPRAGLPNMTTDGSSTEDFRSVIDDLTIENKKLKRRLRKYGKSQDSHMKEERLFEVRVHGLPPEKKRELEDMLRKFTAGLSTSAVGFPANGYEGLPSSLNPHKTTSSPTSLQNDSAYASMSTSAQGSSARSGIGSQHKRRPFMTASRHQNIHTYLHQIPEGLLPQQHPASMTESAKKKLVVRRLEQIFAGKGAVGAHQHPLQQQEVSHSAARADQVADEAHGSRARQEGAREASILARDIADPLHPTNELQDADGASPGAAASLQQPERKRKVDSIDQALLVEQRPTRPLDLDPYRAQIPAENIQYIRHLGFSPPDVGRQAEEGHGWVYLNLLINMAQLHTINVTPDFVRKALTDFSKKFEMSPDGRKVRWQGGFRVTRGSSTAGDSPTSRKDFDTADSQSPRKRPKIMHRTSARSQGLSENRLGYTPLFSHRGSTDESDDSSSEDESISDPFPGPIGGDSSGMTSSGIRTNSTKKQTKREDGPVIFYNNVRFCTDLSGERRPGGNPYTPSYVPLNAIPVGRPSDLERDHLSETRGPLVTAKNLPEPMDLADNPIPEHLELTFPRSSPLPSHAETEVEPIDLSVTGIGGVWPADNFAIAVESRHAIEQHDAVPEAGVAASMYLPAKLRQILYASGESRNTRGTTHRHQIVSAYVKELQPSTLPPAVSFWNDIMDEDDSDMDDDERSESPPPSPNAMLPATAPQPVGVHYYLDEEDEEEDNDEDEDEDGDDDNSEGSLDLLALARECDPEAIRAKEREYDANLAERLADEIPAGSSAATAGGGSGFASSASGVKMGEYSRALKDARARAVQLHRSGTGDSMAAQSSRDYSSGEDEDENEEDDGMSDIRS